MDRRTTIQRAVAANARAELARRGVKQAAVADLLHITQSQISKRLVGQIPFSAVEIVLLAEFLEVDPAELLTRRPVAA